MQRQTERRARTHERIASRQLVDILREQRPLPDIEEGARLFEVAKRSGQRHNCQTDPEEDEEAREVRILARRVKVRHARLVFDRRENPPLVLLAQLFAYGGGGLDAGRGVLGRCGRASSTASRALAMVACADWMFPPRGRESLSPRETRYVV